MISYRVASINDATKIAHLHAQSWKDNYHSVLTEDYIKHGMMSDRLSVWKERFEKTNPRQHVILAEENNQLIGFACTYLHHDPTFGALLDNLHVLGQFKRKGIGKELMNRSVKWVYENDPSSKFYLWVLEDNISAIEFYKKNSGIEKGKAIHEMPDGSRAYALRIVWNNLKVILKDQI